MIDDRQDIGVCHGHHLAILRNPTKAAHLGPGDVEAVGRIEVAPPLAGKLRLTAGDTGGELRAKMVLARPVLRGDGLFEPGGPEPVKGTPNGQSVRRRGAVVGAHYELCLVGERVADGFHEADILRSAETALHLQRTPARGLQARRPIGESPRQAGILRRIMP